MRLADGKELGHADLDNPVCSNFAADSTGLTVVATDEFAYSDVVDLRTGKAITRLRAPILSDTQMLPILAGAGADLRVVLHNKTRVAVLEVPRPDTSLPLLRSLGVRADGKNLVAVTPDASELRVYPVGRTTARATARRPAPHWRSPHGPAGTRDGTLLADRISADRVVVRRFPSLEPVREITTAAIPPRDTAGAGDLNTNLYFDAANRLVVAVGHVVEVFDPMSGVRRARLDLDQIGHTAKGQSAWVEAGSDEGRLGLYIDGKPGVHILDAMTGRLIGTVPVADVRGAVFQNASPYVAIAREGNVVEIWDWQKRRRALGPLTSADSGRVGGLGQPGRFVITDPGEYRIMRVGSTTPELSVQLGRGRQVTSVSQDGRTVIYGDGLDPFIGVLQLRPAVWRQHICAVFGNRGFTDSERAALPSSTPRQPLCPT